MSKTNDDMAIVGMACVYPGAPDMKTFWNNILSKVDAVSDPPPGWGDDVFYNPASRDANRIYCKRGGFIDEYCEFNPVEYGIMPSAIDGADPQHFMALRLAYGVLNDAGYLKRSFDRKRTAVIMGRGQSIHRGIVTLLQHGMIVDQTLQILRTIRPEFSELDIENIQKELKQGLPSFTADTCPGLISNLMTARICNRLDLQGPNYTVDAACASALIAVDAGINELRSRRCDMAIVGASQVTIPVQMFMVFCIIGALSRKGKVRPFDKDADGTLLGEGIGMMALKRRVDAERDQDRIYALIKGIGVASDGKAQGLLAPRFEGELTALERAYEISNINPSTVGLIEAHGTGTSVGDETEIRVLRKFFGDRCGEFPDGVIGTVKSMIGHTIPASGMAALIKTALALYFKVLPPTLIDTPNPQLEIEKTPFYLNSELRAWIHGKETPRRAGVNAFGFGGINTHAILEECHCPSSNLDVPPIEFGWDSEIIILQGSSRQELISKAKRLLAFISGPGDVNLKDLAFTLNCPLKGDLSNRLSILAGSINELEKKLSHAMGRLADANCIEIKDRRGIFFTEKPLSNEGKLAFVFPGEGSQYVNMLSDLNINFQEVRSAFDIADLIFSRSEQRPFPSQVLYPPEDLTDDIRRVAEKTLWQMEYAYITVESANKGLYDLLRQLNLMPDTIVGHSIGDYSACMASGMLDDLDDLAKDQIIDYQLEIKKINQQAFDLVPSRKLMTVGVVKQSVLNNILSKFVDKVFVAMDNCPNQVVLCGRNGIMESVRKDLSARGAFCSFLPFDRGYHTPEYQPICDLFTRLSKQIPVRKPKYEIYSCATSRPYPDDVDEIRKIMVDQWAQPVRFRETIEAMYKDGVRIFVEVGPKGNLTSFIEDILGHQRYAAIAANLSTRSDISQLNFMIGFLAVHGVPMELDYLYTHRNPERLPIFDDPEEAEVEADIKKKTAPMKIRLDLPWLSLNKSKLPDISQMTDLVDKLPKKNMADSPDFQVKSPPIIKAKTKDAFHPVSIQISDKSPPAEIRASVNKNPHNASSSHYKGISPHRATLSSAKVGYKYARSDVMHFYFNNMEQFLGIQQGILSAYLKAKKDGGTPK